VRNRFLLLALLVGFATSFSLLVTWLTLHANALSQEQLNAIHPGLREEWMVDIVTLNRDREFWPEVFLWAGSCVVIAGATLRACDNGLFDEVVD